MDKNKLTTWIVAVGTGIAFFVFFTTLAGAVWGTPTLAEDSSALFTQPGIVQNENATSSSTEVVSNAYAEPARLLIPSISVNAKVQRVGLTAAHAMGIPTNFTDVAWYKNGPVPGAMGSAVIDGHVDNGLGLNGVFKHLTDVKVGDDVYIIDTNESRIHFKVIQRVEYPYNAAPTEEIFGSTGKPLLRLITCDGRWVKSARTYDTRLVVTAELVQ